ncbi:PREDICTED: uncharacterized protein LOC105454178 [Wasmannia auropunctata]|uniref:uncharacterized protein LOC105454178 n=1 Tax=Wasmannia auropunctata TaxID=64793 RepID=UPI0005EE471D|nr:PREDICTED: uncharacterized protein LOC105454178 [Wasmannia auropunctata]
MLRFTIVTGCTLLSVCFDFVVASAVAADVDSLSQDFHPCSIRTKPFLMDMLETFSMFVVERLILLVSPFFSNWKRRLALTGLIESLSASNVRHLQMSSSFSDACFMIFRRTRSFSSSRSADINSSFIELCFNAHWRDNFPKTHLFEDDGCFCAASSSRFSLPSDAPECFVPSDDALMQCDLGHAQTDITSRPPILRTRANSFNACTLLSVVAKWCTTAIDSTASKLSSRNGRAKLSQIRTFAQQANEPKFREMRQDEIQQQSDMEFRIVCNRCEQPWIIDSPSVTQHQTRHRSKRFDVAPLFIHASCLYVND